MSADQEELRRKTPRDPPSLPAHPSLRRIFLEAIQDPGKARRVIAIMAAGFVGIATVVASARGIRVHWRTYAVPVPSIAAFSTACGSVITIATVGIKKAIVNMWKAQQERKARERKAQERKARKQRRAAASTPEHQTSKSSSSSSPKQRQRRQRSRPLWRTRPQSGRYQLQLG